MSTKTMNKQFAEDLINGLMATPKAISSKYFYDEIGDRIFQSIMQLKEYYPTNCEFEIFSMQKENILSTIQRKKGAFNLIEFGAGDGYKTKVLLRHFLSAQAEFSYVPIDISGNALDSLSEDLHSEMPELDVNGFQGEYFNALKRLNEFDERRKVILFLGSNIGNFSDAQSLKFLDQLRDHVSPGDQVIIGFDLKKDPRVILEAYDDKKGVTKAFNLNLLNRINREFDADFDLNQFDHFPVYDPLTGTTKSYLISKAAQTVNIEALDMQVAFKAWEVIHTEISQKFDMEMIESLAKRAGFKVDTNFFDCKHYYLDSLWVPVD